MANNNGVELKGGMYTFMSLRISTTDLAQIDSALGDKVQQAPGFFKDTPVVLDLDGLDDEDCEKLDAGRLLDCVRRHQLIPIVARLGSKSSQFASALTLPLIEGGVRKSESSNASAADPSEADHESGTASSDKNGAADDATKPHEIEYIVKTPMLVRKPIRSGQQVYAKDTDLIVMGPVGPGAEVIADNNIHVYGSLRGRALCGVSGNTGTRIFCQSLEAELVSVAGNYRMLETIPEELRGKPAQISFSNDRLSIEPL